MSDILRPTVPRREVFVAGLTTLAKLAHQAEDTNDDVLLLEVMDEVSRRGHIAGRIFREEYIRLHAEIAAARKQSDK